MIRLKVTKFREGTMKPKKGTKLVSHKNTRDTKNTRMLLYMPPAAVRPHSYCISLRRPGDYLLCEQIEP